MILCVIKYVDKITDKIMNQPIHRPLKKTRGQGGFYHAGAGQNGEQNLLARSLGYRYRSVSYRTNKRNQRQLRNFKTLQSITTHLETRSNGY